MNTNMISCTAVLLVGVLALTVTSAGRAQQERIVERLFRSTLTDVKPVFAPGERGNPEAVIGLDTQSVVFEINESIERGVIPRPRHSDAEPVGRMTARLRCIGNARIDKNKPMQILVGEASFVGRSMSFDARGTAIAHWVKDENGNYNGVRWTDFSGTMTNIRGRDPGAKGHVVGTRLLIGDPDIQRQSGLIIVRFRE